VLSERTYYAVAGQSGRACDDTQVLLTGNTALRFGMLCGTQSALRVPYARSLQCACFADNPALSVVELLYCPPKSVYVKVCVSKSRYLHCWLAVQYLVSVQSLTMLQSLLCMHAWFAASPVALDCSLPGTQLAQACACL